MAAPTPPSMPSGLPKGATDYLKKNWRFAYAGGLGLAFLGLDLKNVLDSDNKLKALLKTFKDFILVRVAMIGLFTGIRDVMKGLVRDTGSLDAALKRLTQVQQYARQFQAFTGSLSSAKQKISELHQLSTRGVFRFEDLVEANKSLQIFTRGTYTSVEATKKIGEAALASGNSIQDTARAVGNFYDVLRSGGPVGQASEQLRQMNLISGSTADELTNMSESGASATTTFSVLTDALEKAGEGAAGYKDELQSITEKHAKAVEELKIAFGAPWTQADVQSTKNMSDGMKSITPVVAQLSKQFAFLYNGATTLVSALFKWATGNKFLQASLVILANVIMVATVAAGVFGVSALFPLIRILQQVSIWAGQEAFVAITKLTGSMAAAAIAGRVLSGVMATLLIGTTILMAVGFVTALVGAVIKAQDEAQKAQKDFQEWEKSLRDATAAILEQAAAVTTLASKYEALHKTIDKLSDLQKEHADLTKNKQNIDAQIETFHRLGRHGRPIPQELLDKKQATEAKLAANERQQRILQQSREEQAARQPLHEQLIKQEAERRYFFEQQSKDASQRDTEARQGGKVAAESETKKSAIVAKRIELEKKLQDEQEAFEARKATSKVTPLEIAQQDAKTLASQKEINQLKVQERDIGLTPGTEYSATFKEARAQQLRDAKKAVELEAELKGKEGAPIEEKRELQAKLKQAREMAGPEAIAEYKARPEALAEAEKVAQIATRREAEPPSPEELRQERVQAKMADVEIKGHEARRRGDIAGAQAMEDLGSFMQHFEEKLPLFGKDKAAEMAQRQTADEIAQQYQQAAQVTSSMQAVGGGGEVSGVDPQLEASRRQVQLQTEMVGLLRTLTGQEPDQTPQPTFQQ